ncbi:hypothetical protein RTP6_005079 [Batrachochytrium dendrobatidis]
MQSNNNQELHSLLQQWKPYVTAATHRPSTDLQSLKSAQNIVGTTLKSSSNGFKSKKMQSKVVLTNEYGFLASVKETDKSHFQLQTEFSRALFKKTFHTDAVRGVGSHSLADLNLYMQQEFRDVFSNSSDMLSKSRIQSLDRCLEQVIETFRSYSSLLSDIQNEYHLVIKAIVNIQDEKAFLRSKINKLLVGYAFKQTLEAEKMRIVELVASWEIAQNHRQMLESHSAIEDTKFIETIGKLFDLEVARDQKEKRRKDLLYLGKWQFVKDWIEQRALTDPLIKTLFEQLKENPDYYRKNLVEDENLAVHEYDSLEIRKLKRLIEEQQRLTKVYAKEFAAVNSKEQFIATQISNVEQNIEKISTLLQSKFKSNFSVNCSRNDATFKCRY